MAPIGTAGGYHAVARRLHSLACACSRCRMIVVLDTGGFDGLAPVDERRRARLRVLRARADDLVVPAAVLAEGVLRGHPGHDYHVQRLLEITSVAVVDQSLGQAAGQLRRTAIGKRRKSVPSGVDAVVVAAADTHAASAEVVIVTSDRDDIEVLCSSATNGDRLSVLVV